MWQDVLIACCSLAIAAIMIPQLYASFTGKYHVHPITAGCYGVILILMGVAFASLSLALATSANAVCAIFWIVIAIRSWRKKK